MSDRGIIFGPDMIRAIRAGRKTQTRRIIQGVARPRSPYGGEGDTLWVRETWAAGPGCDGLKPSDIPEQQYLLRWYRADLIQGLPKMAGRWRSPIHMPRWISRIDLRILSVRPERLHTISEADAEAEGVTLTPCTHPDCAGTDSVCAADFYRGAFANAWDKIQGKRKAPQFWAENPWVWRIEFVGPVVGPSIERKGG